LHIAKEHYDKFIPMLLLTGKWKWNSKQSKSATSAKDLLMP
jgi:hypothetical protein